MAERMNPNIKLALAWYSASEWNTWRTICSDGETYFSIPYDTWQQLATAAKSDQEALGYSVVTVPINVADFLHWAENNERGTRANDRVAFAAFSAATSSLHSDPISP